MRKVTGWLAPLAVLLMPVAALAQDDPAQADAMPELDLFAGLAEAFAVEPLTPEQEARLPLAQTVIDRMLPEGSMMEMMGGMFDSFLTPIAEVAQPQAADVVARKLGLSTWDLSLTEEQAAQAAALFDPAWQERERRKAEAMPQMMTQLFAGMEPGIRSAMAELYAIYFDEAELADIDAFFATPTGAAFARKSFTLASDPRLVGTMFRDMPGLFGDMATIDSRIAETVSDLPPERTFDDLSPTERKGLAQLLGMSVEDLEAQAMWVSGDGADYAP